MFTVPDRPRVRFRLLNERLNVLMMLARRANEEEDAVKKRTWAELAAFDMGRLSRLVKAYEGEHWKNVATSQESRLDTLREDLGLSILPGLKITY